MRPRLTSRMVAAALAGWLAGWVDPAGVMAQAGGPYHGVPPKSHGEAIARARKLVEQYMGEERMPGLQVSVAAGGAIVWSEGFGLADLEQMVAVTPITKFQSGSIGKSHTAVGLALLHEQGKLDWDAPVQKYVPYFPDKGHPITIRQLAGHLSGIRHYRSYRDFITYTRYPTYRDGLDEFKDDPLLFEPGTRYSYSSYGYNLLGVVIEEITGQEYMSFMRQHVLGPLGMRDTDAMYWNSIIPYRARLYERPSMATPNSYKVGFADPRLKNTEELINAPYTDISHKTPSGGFVGTTDDLVRFASALLQPGILKAETLKLLFTSQRTKSGQETGYGMGWNIGKDDEGRRIYSHGGGPVGATAHLLVYPDEKVVVAVMVNLTSAPLDDLSKSIGEAFVTRTAEAR
ncbi:MAG: beta-lactamase family protein [Gemmatimonadetes bacterium]|nr:beta-lactamase family protein [Gemmatimonadota bacterium]